MAIVDLVLVIQCPSDNAHRRGPQFEDNLSFEVSTSDCVKLTHSFESTCNVLAQFGICMLNYSHFAIDWQCLELDLDFVVSSANKM